MSGPYTYPEIAYSIRHHAGKWRHDDSHNGQYGRHDGCLLHADPQFFHVDGEVRIQHVQSCSNKINPPLYMYSGIPLWFI